MIASRRQEAVYDTWENTDKNILIQAVAGSGKTTTLLEIVRRCDKRTLFLAFNKAIQEEIQGRIDNEGLRQGKALTMHALGLMAIRNWRNFQIKSNKNMQMVKVVQDRNIGRMRQLTWEKKVQLSFTLMDFNDVSRIYLTDDMDEIITHMGNMDKSYYKQDDAWLESLWRDMLELRHEFDNELRPIIDFNDMIYLPIVKELYIPVHCSYLLVDEAQDLNYAQHILLDRFIDQGHIQRWVAVGDTNQSIYGFSGSYENSFDRFKEKPNTVELPLDICYRCPVQVLNYANEIYNVMDGHKRNDGTVATVKDPAEVKHGSLVICRNTAPLIDLFFVLLGLGKAVNLKGEDMLPAIRKFLKPYTYRTVAVAKKKMYDDLLTLEHRKEYSDNDRAKYFWFKNQYDNVVALITHMVPDRSIKVKDLVDQLDTVFSETSVDAITLCTIHKAKGLENPVVYILNEHLIPSKMARSDQQLKQEKNLKYVARTRAMEEMYFLNL